MDAQISQRKVPPGAGFHHSYLLLLPEKLITNAPLLVVTPTPPTSENPEEFERAAERIASNASRFLGKLQIPLLIPVLPRPPLKVSENQFINLYLPALSRAALTNSDPHLGRIDLQVIAMIDHARQVLLKERGVPVEEKAIFCGFSAAGHFATRMAILHPQRVLAVWAGGTGVHPIVPLAEYKGKALTYPVGVADLKDLIGRRFDQREFQKVKVRIVQGGEDSNVSLPAEDKPSESYSFAQAELYRELFGTTASQRIEKLQETCQQAGYGNITLKIIQGAGHQITPDTAADMINFIAEEVHVKR
jgi:dienelactone hydrolase